MVGLASSNINYCKHLVFWKKSTSKQVLRFKSISVYLMLTSKHPSSVIFCDTNFMFEHSELNSNEWLTYGDVFSHQWYHDAT